MLNKIFDRLFKDAPAPEPMTDIDRQARWEAWLAEKKREAVQRAELEADRTRISIVVWSWSRDCVTYGEKRELPTKVPKGVRAWLDGLSVREIMALVEARDDLIKLHMYGDTLIPCVRKLQPLPPTMLRFPSRRQETEGQLAGGRRRRG
jgi:hypothetical protein